jgi:aldehyde:ferredoxin oxidoreductase
MPHGFWGKLLIIDLTNQTTRVDTFSAGEARQFFLGSGLSAKLLYERLDPASDPLAPENPLIWLAGLFTGGMLPATSKLCVCCRSPQTGIWNEATVGGHWPAEFRRTGYDGVIFEGESDRPVYVTIRADGVTFHDATFLWGRDTYQVEADLRPLVGEKAKIATIGQAGERQVLISSIIFDPPITRVAARGGVGAVMGAKKLKAVVVEGDPANKLTVADPEGLKAQLKEDSPRIRKNAAGLTEFGTSGGVVTVEAYGDLPIKNWQLGAWKEGAQKITGQTMQPDNLARHYSCFACPIRCGKIYEQKDKGIFGHGPEYETLGMLGANVLNDDVNSIIEGNEWCNRYGIDTISTGAVIGFGIEAYERELIDRQTTGGLPLDWNGESMLALVHKIGRGEDVGQLLGQGVRKAASELGGNAADFAVHTKGMEYPAHDPRGHVSMALNYATASRGACHLEALTYFIDRGVAQVDLGFTEATDPHTSADKPPLVYKAQNYLHTFNPLGLCKFLWVARVGPSTISNWLNAVTGWDTDMAEVMETGERLFNLKRMYNVRLGIRRKDDVLPPRLGVEGKPDGFAKDVLPDLALMLPEYYTLRGWDTDGVPQPATLARLKLDTLVG